MTAANQAFASGVSAAILTASVVLIGAALVVLAFGPRGAAASAAVTADANDEVGELEAVAG